MDDERIGDGEKEQRHLKVMPRTMTTTPALAEHTAVFGIREGVKVDGRARFLCTQTMRMQCHKSRCDELSIFFSHFYVVYLNILLLLSLLFTISECI